MAVSGIDHVNILTRDLDATAAFYAQVLDLTREQSAGAAMGFAGAWMRDCAGQAIVHLVWKDPASNRYDGYEPGEPTNGLHHVAFRCEGFAAMREKLDGMGLSYRVNDRQYGDVRQIFLVDPNAVNVELNFPGD